MEQMLVGFIWKAFKEILWDENFGEKETAMTISERIFELLDEKGMSQKEFSELTNIGQSTISDWKRFHTNPSADKILPICKALNITPEELLSGRDSVSTKDRKRDYIIVNKNSEEGSLLEEYGTLTPGQRQRLIGYLHAMQDLMK